MTHERQHGMPQPEIITHPSITTALINLLPESERENYIDYSLVQDSITVTAFNTSQETYYRAVMSDTLLVGEDLEKLLGHAIRVEPEGRGDAIEHSFMEVSDYPEGLYQKHERYLASHLPNGALKTHITYDFPLVRKALLTDTDERIKKTLANYALNALSHYYDLNEGSTLPPYVTFLRQDGNVKKINIGYDGSSQNIYLLGDRRKGAHTLEREEPTIVVHEENALIPGLFWSKNKESGERAYYTGLPASATPEYDDTGVSDLYNKIDSRINPTLGLALIVAFSPEQNEKIPNESHFRSMAEAQILLWLTTYNNRNFLLESPIFKNLEELARRRNDK